MSNLTPDQLIAEAETILNGEPVATLVGYDDDAVEDEENVHQQIRIISSHDQPWCFIDRHRDAVRLQILLKSPQMEAIHPVLRSLGKAKRAALPPLTEVLSRLDHLASEAPNCGEFLELVKSQLHLHHYTRQQTPLRLMPTLLVGPPGIGKTFIVGRVAKCLDMYHERIALSNATESFVLSGCPRGYATTTPGEVAEKLALSDIINPLIILDEMDKATYQRSDRATIEGPLLTLLEPETAKRFEDACLRLTLDASHVSWIATANSLAPLPEPILSRFVVVHIAPLIPADQERLMASQLAELLAELGLTGRRVMLAPPIQERFNRMSVREFRCHLRLGIARRLLKTPDAEELWIEAEDLIVGHGQGSQRRPIGFSLLPL